MNRAARPSATAPCRTSCRPTWWVRSITRDPGAIRAMTPWQTPTDPPARPRAGGEAGGGERRRTAHARADEHHPQSPARADELDRSDDVLPDRAEVALALRTTAAP